MVHARFEGGPYDGVELALIGRTPSYVLLMDAPAGSAMSPIVCGADFDDDWPGQQRYELVAHSSYGDTGTATYRHKGEA